MNRHDQTGSWAIDLDRDAVLSEAMATRRLMSGESQCNSKWRQRPDLVSESVPTSARRGCRDSP